MYDKSLREEELKNKVASDWFGAFDTTKIIGNIDFCVAQMKEQGDLFSETKSFLWAEAKKGTNKDIYESFVQLIMTIGKAKTYEKHLPPIYVGAFDAEKIAVIEYKTIMAVFSQNDFDWTVTPSNHETKEFRQLYDLVKTELEKKSQIFYYQQDGKILKKFIKTNLKGGSSQIIVTKNNFVSIYLRWLKVVKPAISVDWEVVKKAGILDADFYLADLLSKDNESIKDTLFVVLDKNKYKYNKNTDELGDIFREAVFNDNQKAHGQFWNTYKRPPQQKYINYMINRRDLLVPQDVRERKGSFFTPEKWVNLSQQYIADVYGENWQEEYYVWDCCAGTGNLLRGLNPDYKCNYWASTLDKADVDVMKDQIKNNNAPLFESHVFQMDFLNDRFEDKCPKGLLEIIQDEDKRKKLIIYINPPYAEAGNMKQLTGNGKNKEKVSTTSYVYSKYKDIIGKASNEIFAQFFARVYQELNGSQLAEFSKLKILQAGNFAVYRKFFKAELKKFFMVPANTFDNVKGQFPIGFFVWDTGNYRPLRNEKGDVYDAKGEFMFIKNVHCPQQNEKNIGNWIAGFRDRENNGIGMLNSGRNDFQHQFSVYFQQTIINDVSHALTLTLTLTNLLAGMVFTSVRLVYPAFWLNDRDQFFAPSEAWKDDKEFQSDCLAYALFCGQNRITTRQGINHFIPFRENEVGAKDEFESHFMTDYIKNNHIVFSAVAQRVMDKGRELWRYYHCQEGVNLNASYYDIRAYFQGRDDKGRMKNISADETYNRIISDLRLAMKELAAKIQPKVYEYGFLR